MKDKKKSHRSGS